MRLVAMMLAAALASAAEAADDSALRACRAEPDDARRLACYDREIDRATPGPAPARAEPPAAPPPAAASAEDQFGREAELVREEKERVRAAAREIGEITALVTEIQRRSDGLMLITLDNGQVWKQVGLDSLFRLKVGDPVRIESASLGSYMMWGTSKRPTRVSRVN